MAIMAFLCYNKRNPCFLPMSTELIPLIGTYLMLIVAIAFTFLVFSTIITNLMVKVPFVPSRMRIIRHVAKLANIQKNDNVYDLGCGDGRFLIEADKYTSQPLTGFEQAPLPYLMAKIRTLFNKKNIHIIMQNFLRANLRDADVIYCYLGPEAMIDVGKKIRKECRKGTRIFSNTFSITDMKPTKVWPKDKSRKLPTLYLYTV